MNESLKLSVKKKVIPMLTDFCLEESIEYHVKPQTFPDTDWDFIMTINEVKTAVIAGMFLRENRIEVAGMDQQKFKKGAAAAPKKTKEEKEEKDEKDDEESINKDASEPKSIF